MLDGVSRPPPHIKNDICLARRCYRLLRDLERGRQSTERQDRCFLTPHPDTSTHVQQASMENAVNSLQ